MQANMRRIVSILLAVMFCVACFTGCGSSKDNGGTASVDVRNAKSIADLAGAKIAAQTGTFHADALEQIPNVQASTYPEFSDLLTALKSGAIDGYVAEEPTAFSVCASNDDLTYLPFKNNDTGFTATAADVGIAISDGAQIAREIADVTVGADDLHELVTLKKISNGLMERIHRNYRLIVGINTSLIVLGVAGVFPPTTSALLHNTSTLLISLKSMNNLLDEKEEVTEENVAEAFA